MMVLGGLGGEKKGNVGGGKGKKRDQEVGRNMV